MLVICWRLCFHAFPGLAPALHGQVSLPPEPCTAYLCAFPWYPEVFPPYFLIPPCMGMRIQVHRYALRHPRSWLRNEALRSLSGLAPHPWAIPVLVPYALPGSGLVVPAGAEALHSLLEVPCRRAHKPHPQPYDPIFGLWIQP